MTAVAESIGPQLETFKEQLVLSGDVQLSKTMQRMRAMWQRARVEQAKAEFAASRAAAEALAVASKDALLVVVISMRTLSEINTHEHWKKVRRKVGHQRSSVALAMRSNANARGLKIKPPCFVRIFRIAPDLLDKTDNLPAACKHVIDGVADWLGIDDRSETVQWECHQEQAKHYAVRVEVRV